MTTSTETNLETVGRDVEARSTSLKKELGLRDLVLTQVVFVFGTVWVGFSAKRAGAREVGAEFWRRNANHHGRYFDRDAFHHCGPRKSRQLSSVFSELARDEHSQHQRVQQARGRRAFRFRIYCDPRRRMP